MIQLSDKKLNEAIRFVGYLVNKNKCYGREDAHSAGNIGLVEALHKYNPDNEQGCSFISFAQFHIKRRIYDYMYSNMLIHIPKEKVKQGISVEICNIDIFSETLSKKVSVDIPIIEKETIEKVLRILNDKEKELLFKRYYDSLTLSAIGKELGISKEAVRVKINKIMNRLRSV